MAEWEVVPNYVSPLQEQKAPDPAQGAPMPPSEWSVAPEFQTAKPAGESSTTANVTRQVAKSLTLGAAPRFEAYWNWITGGGSYSDNLKDINERNDKFEAAHPYVSTGIQLAGGALLPIPGAALAGRLAQTGVMNATRGGQAVLAARAAGVAAQAPRLARVAGMAAEGATGAGIASAVSSKDYTKPMDVLSDAAHGAAIGGAIGSVLPPIGDTAKALQPWVPEIAGRIPVLRNIPGARPQDAAVRATADAFEGRGLKPAAGERWDINVRRDENAFEAARAAQARPGQPDRIVNYDPTMTALTGRAAETGAVDPARATRYVHEVMGPNGTEQAQRVADAVPGALGSPPNYPGHAQFMHDVEHASGAGMDAAYAAFRQGPQVRVNGLAQTMQDLPRMAPHVNNAIDDALARSQITAAEAAAMRANPDTLHPAVAEGLYRELSQANNPRGDTTGLLDRLRAMLAGPPGVARAMPTPGQQLLELKANHAARHSEREAAQLGERSPGQSGVPLRETMQTYTSYPPLPPQIAPGNVRPADQAGAFRNAAMGGLQQDILDTAASTNPVQGVFNSPLRQDYIRSVFPNSQGLGEMLGREQRAYDTATQVLRMGEGAQQLNRNIPSEVAQSAKLGVTAFMSKPWAFRQWLSDNMHLNHLNKARAAEVARLQLSSTPADHAAIYNLLAQRSRRQLAQDAMVRLLARGAAVPIADAVGGK